MYAKVQELVAMKNLCEEFQKRRKKMLREKIDCSKFLTWFIEEYPESAERTRKADSAWWQQFR